MTGGRSIPHPIPPELTQPDPWRQQGGGIVKIWNPQILANWVAGPVATDAWKANLDVLNQGRFSELPFSRCAHRFSVGALWHRVRPQIAIP